MEDNTIQALKAELAAEKQYSKDLEKQLTIVYSKYVKLQKENSLMVKL